MRVTAKLWENKHYQEFIKKTVIPKSIKEDIDDLVQIILDKVKVNNHADEIFLSSKTNSDIIDI